MKKEHWEYLKENDPIHYAEMKGDPVTGQNMDNSFTEGVIIFFILFIVFCVGLSIYLN
jgi:hypothetical protein